MEENNVVVESFEVISLDYRKIVTVFTWSVNKNRNTDIPLNKIIHGIPRYLK